MKSRPDLLRPGAAYRLRRAAAARHRRLFFEPLEDRALLAYAWVSGGMAAFEGQTGYGSFGRSSSETNNTVTVT